MHFSYAGKKGIDLLSHPKPPLCKGRWHGASRDGGIVTGLTHRCNAKILYSADRFVYNPSVTFGDSSLYTREPLVQHFRKPLFIQGDP